MCFGPFTKLCHWGPLTALGIIKVVTGMTIYCNGMWWPSDTLGGFLNSTCFMTLSGLTLYNFLSAVFHGPGFLPFNWQIEDENESENLQYCVVCRGYKAPRSHHCRKCGRCVLKMDHHCPWINNCVGWGNHAHFIAFLLFAVLGCSHASVILSCSLYRGLHKVYYIYNSIGNGPIIHLNTYGIIICVFSVGLAVGVVVAVGMLLICQIRSILRNRTGVEEWIFDKANHRHRNASKPFKFPYDLGWRRNMKQVVNWTCQPVGNGIFWEVAEDCDQYTLTNEQIQQKIEKRQRTKLYNILKAASGSWVPICHGIGVLLHPPWSDEPRIKLDVGDAVNVTRWQKYWLFGEKIQPDIPDDELPAKRIRGWFPRKCAVEIVEPNEEESQQNFNQKKVN